MTTDFNSGLLLRCDGNRELGLGHLYRAMVIAGELAPGRSLIVTRRDPTALRLLEAGGVEFVLLPDSCLPENEPAFLANLAAERDIPFVLLDRKNNDRDYVQALAAAGLLVVDLEDLGPGRDCAHLLIDSHIWPDTPDSLYRGQALCGFGPDWAILHPAFRETADKMAESPPEQRFQHVEEVVIALGGTDPAGLATLVIDQLDHICRDFRITLVAGPGSTGKEPGSLYHELRVVRGASPLADVLASAQLAVVSGGITMLESLCLGLPTLVVPQNREQYVNAARYAARKIVSLVPPPGDNDHHTRIYRALDQLFEDPPFRYSLANAAGSRVDGRGLERLAGALGYLEAAHGETALRGGLPL